MTAAQDNTVGAMTSESILAADGTTVPADNGLLSFLNAVPPAPSDMTAAQDHTVTATTSESFLAADGTTVPADNVMLLYWDTMPPATPTVTATAATPIPSDDASGTAPIDNVIPPWDAVRSATPTTTAVHNNTAAISILGADGHSTMTTGRMSLNLASSISPMSESTSRLSRIPVFPSSSLWPPAPALPTSRAVQQDTIAVPSIPDATGAVSQAVASSSTLPVSTHDPANINSEANPSNSGFVVHVWDSAVRRGVYTGKKRRNPITNSDNPEAFQKRGKR